jgi:hemin uptake protein HemP
MITNEQYAMNTMKPNSPLALPPTPAVSQNTSVGPGMPCVRSEDLIGKDREIVIEHAGAHYRLRITRANKLILTK